VIPAPRVRDLAAPGTDRCTTRNWTFLLSSSVKPSVQLDTPRGTVWRSSSLDCYPRGYALLQVRGGNRGQLNRGTSATPTPTWSGRATPNRWVEQVGVGLEPGRVLDLAGGEGSQCAVAGRGWRATVVDFSPVGLNRACALAAERFGAEDQRLPRCPRTC